MNESFNGANQWRMTHYNTGQNTLRQQPARLSDSNLHLRCHPSHFLVTILLLDILPLLWRPLRLFVPMTGRGLSYQPVSLSVSPVLCHRWTEINFVMSSVTSLAAETEQWQDEVTAALSRLKGGERERHQEFQ